MRHAVLSDLVALAASVLLAGSWSANASGKPCVGGWFDWTATVVRTEPTQALLKVRDKLGGMRSVGLNDVLCGGDTVVVPRGVSVELRQSGKVRLVNEAGEYRISDSSAVIDAASTIVANLMELAGGLRPPVPRPDPTGSRGLITVVNQLKPIMSLPKRHRQRLTADMPTLVSWRGGSPPYRCLAIKEDLTPVWLGDDVGKQGWCVIPEVSRSADRITVRDSREKSTGWNIRVTTWEEVPRPAWLATLPSEMLSADRTAWAAWLWHEGDPAFRLQALGMLNREVDFAPVAGQLVDYILDEKLLPRNLGE